MEANDQNDADAHILAVKKGGKGAPRKPRQMNGSVSTPTLHWLTSLICTAVFRFTVFTALLGVIQSGIERPFFSQVNGFLHQVL